MVCPIMVSWWSWPLHRSVDHRDSEEISDMGFCRFTCKISSHLLVRNQQKTPRIIVPHRKHSLAKRVFEVELVFVSCDVSPGEKMLLGYMLDMLVVLLVQKRLKNKQFAQLQPWEFFFSNRWSSKTFTENLSNAIRLVKLRGHWRSTWAWWLKFGPGHKWFPKGVYSPSRLGLIGTPWKMLVQGSNSEILVEKSPLKQLSQVGVVFVFIPIVWDKLSFCKDVLDSGIFKIKHEWSLGYGGYVSMKGIFGFPGCVLCRYLFVALYRQRFGVVLISSVSPLTILQTPREIGPNRFWRLLREMFEKSTGKNTHALQRKWKNSSHTHTHTWTKHWHIHTHCNYLRNIVVLVSS